MKNVLAILLCSCVLMVGCGGLLIVSSSGGTGGSGGDAGGSGGAGGIGGSGGSGGIASSNGGSAGVAQECSSSLDCNDGDACTADRCSPDGVCAHATIGNLPGCNDAGMDDCVMCADTSCMAVECQAPSYLVVCANGSVPQGTCTTPGGGYWCCCPDGGC